MPITKIESFYLFPFCTLFIFFSYLIALGSIFILAQEENIWLLLKFSNSALFLPVIVDKRQLLKWDWAVTLLSFTNVVLSLIWSVLTRSYIQQNFHFCFCYIKLFRQILSLGIFNRVLTCQFNKIAHPFFLCFCILFGVS